MARGGNNWVPDNGIPGYALHYEGRGNLQFSIYHLLLEIKVRRNFLVFAGELGKNITGFDVD